MLIPDLPKALEEGMKKEKPSNEWDEKKLHVSDLAVSLENPEDRKCPRQLWLRIHGAKKQELSAGKMLMFDNGQRLHDRVVELLRKGLPEGWNVEGAEESVSQQLPEGLTGRYDCLLSGPKNTLLVVDFKTLRGRAFSYLDKPKPSHELQVRTYAYALNASAGMILYIDREGQNYAKQFIIPRNDEQVKKAIEIAKSIVEGNIPPKLKPSLDIRENKGPNSVKLKEPWQCSYCEYRDVSCNGAVPREFRTSKIIGYLNEEGFEPKKQFENLRKVVEFLLKEAG